MSDTVAALYVLADGPYSGIAGVDLWPESRDARCYAGPHPVVSHPPCERWGRYWSGGPSARTRRLKGNDRGCFASALWAVRSFGGVLEHPEASHAWRWFGIQRPARGVGWIVADSYGGWTCCVEQGHYGHPARKATWLYAVGMEPLPDLPWGSSGSRQRLDQGFHSAAERAAATTPRPRGRRLTARQNAETPIAFRDLLLSMARSAGEPGA